MKLDAQSSKRFMGNVRPYPEERERGGTTPDIRPFFFAVAAPVGFPVFQNGIQIVIAASSATSSTWTNAVFDPGSCDGRRRAPSPVGEGQPTNRHSFCAARAFFGFQIPDFRFSSC